MPTRGRQEEVDGRRRSVNHYDETDGLQATSTTGSLLRIEGSGGRTQKEQRVLHDDAHPSATILQPCSFNPCNALDFCIVYNQTIYCSCPNGEGYVPFGHAACPSSSFFQDADSRDNNMKTLNSSDFDANYFINVTSSKELCDLNPCAEKAECIPFDEPYCRCHSSSVPFDHVFRAADQPCSAAAPPHAPTEIEVSEFNTSLSASLGEVWYLVIALVAFLILVGILSWKEPASQFEKQPSHKDIEKEPVFHEPTNDVSDMYKEEDELVIHQDDDNAKISHHEHLVDVTKLIGSITVTEVFQHSMPMIEVAFVGHLDQDAIGALALSDAWFDLWEAIMIGGMTAIDTVLAQSFGANEILAFRTAAGNSLIVTQTATVIFAVLLALIGPMMKLIGQDPDLADMAATFSYRLIPGLFPLFAFRHLIKYLQNQDVLLPGILIGPLANGLHVFLNWLLIFQFDWGFHGAAWATTLTRFAQLFMILGYLFWNKNTLLQSTWPTASVSTWKLFVSENTELLKLAGSGAIGEAAIFWAVDISIFFAGYLGTVQMGAYNIVLAIDYVMYMVLAESIQVAVSIRVGQLIGSGDAADAQRSGTVSFFVSSFIHISLVTVIFITRVWISELLTSDPDVAAVVASLIPILFVTFVTASMEPVALGILRGLGQQFSYMAFGIIGHWGVGVPVGLVLAFVAGLEVHGLLWGASIGGYMSALIAIVFLKFRVDWIEEKRKAQELVSSLTRSAEADD